MRLTSMVGIGGRKTTIRLSACPAACREASHGTSALCRVSAFETPARSGDTTRGAASQTLGAPLAGSWGGGAASAAPGKTDIKWASGVYGVANGSLDGDSSGWAPASYSAGASATQGAD